LARSAENRDVPSQRSYAFMHAGQSQASPVLRDSTEIEAGPVILNNQLERLSRSQKINRDQGCIRVFPDISQALLKDAVQAHRDVRRETAGDILLIKLDLESAIVGYFFNVGAHGSRQREGVQKLRMDFMRQMAKVVQNFTETFPHRFHAGTERRHGTVQDFLHAPSFENQGRNSLAIIVVDVAGDAAPLLLLSNKQVPCKFPQFSSVGL